MKWSTLTREEKISIISGRRIDLDVMDYYIESTHNANNECLGDFDRGRTQTAAILVGEVPSTFDPAVSEWSNPPFLG